MAGSKTVVTMHVWQFINFETSQAVGVHDAMATLTCTVRGAESQPTSWKWTPEKTSVFFEVVRYIVIQVNVRN